MSTAASRRQAEAEEQAAASQPSTSRLLTAGEGDDLTCAVCHNPIESGHGYLQAAYGPVHYTDCSSKTVRR